nr:hypothetical protein [Chromatiaceae bacterium]
MTHQEPVIGTLSPAELGYDRPEPWLANAPQDPPPAPPAPGAPEEEARLLGQTLGALIREDGPDAVTTAPVSGVARPVPPQPAPDLWAEGFESRPTSHHPYPSPWLSFRRLLDLVGMSLAFLLFGIAYRAFVALPQAPDQSPWARLGSARLEAAPASNGVVASAPSKNLPPIGQFDFGQSVPPEALPALGQQQPVELYRSIYELEDAFEAKYVPPPTCAGLEANNAADPTDCVNHRLRARRAFLASNGRSMAPEEAPR